ncbi:MAG TPA: hypothetical protein ENI13_02105 [candidate division CPR3 bacterium]|uniref:Uncharacterized protein n=1 Tax=candidate division CPR3 bacterium TaxID=2268181 RepID=A0A7C1NMN0_UNCC3|nr:hypothetical protein [candidate division CPR3 bacterium]
MRYIVEAKTKKQQGIIEEFLGKEKGMKVVDRYDPFERVSSDVRKMGEAMRRFKESDIDWSVFNFYLRGKGIPQQTINAVIGETEKFFKAMGFIK